MKTFIGYFRYLRPYRTALIFGIICSAIYGATGFGAPAIAEVAFKNFFDEDVARDAVPLSQLLLVVAAVMAVFTVRGVFGFLGGYLMTYCGVRMAIDLRCALFERLQQFELAFFSENRSGDLIAKVSEDARDFEKALLDVAADSVRQPAQMLFGLAFLIYVSIQQQQVVYLLVLVVAAPILMIPTRMIAHKLKKRGRQYQEAVGDVTHHLTENLKALEEVRAFQLEEHQSRGFRDKVDRSLMMWLRLRKYILTQQPSMEVISVFVLSVAFIYCFYNRISYAVFSALFLAIYLTIDPIKRILRSVNSIHRAEGPMERIREILEREPAIADPEHPVEIERLEGTIRFEGVHFAYDPTEGEVLSGIDVEIPAGQVVALVGHSGAGKSTFTKLIPRLYDPARGSVSIDGIDIRHLRQADLRKHIALVGQQPVLFDEPLWDNLGYGRPDATREEIEVAARAAFAHDFIVGFENGYDTLAGEGGNRLSVGQKQRVALARAFLKEAPLLIMDEATSALDSESEEFIQKALEELVQGKTVLMIAHRFSSIRLAHRILVFEEGRIVEDGTHDELMAAGGVYRTLHERQQG